MRLFYSLVLGCFLFLSGCRTFDIKSDSVVVLSKGVGLTSSSRFSNIAKLRNEQNHETISCKYYDSSAITKSLIAAKPKTIVLIGHSAGADNSTVICRELQKHGIEVDLLILLDPAFPRYVPSNVKRCVNFYIPSALSDKSKRVKLEVDNTVTEFQAVGIKKLNHHNIDDHFFYVNTYLFGVLIDKTTDSEFNAVIRGEYQPKD